MNNTTVKKNVNKNVNEISRAKKMRRIEGNVIRIEKFERIYRLKKAKAKKIKRIRRMIAYAIAGAVAILLSYVSINILIAIDNIVAN